ncbi:MAG TPA: hypothetical protein VFE60_17850 [Roseiarcus sp.]|jgi:hypothetical protein|nr:hypothetical protein [Roseiarcus sp.]
MIWIFPGVRTATEHLDFSEPRRAALDDCVNEICLRIEEWDEKIDLGESSKDDECRILWAAVHALEQLHRRASGPDITRWFAAWARNRLLAEIYTVTEISNSNEKFSPRCATLLAWVDEINQKLEEWDDKINLGGPSKGGEHIALRAAVHALEQLHRQASGPDITRWFVFWVKNRLMAEIHTID